MDAIINVDRQGATNIVWAYRVTRDDGHEESGGGDSPEDCIAQIRGYSWAAEAPARLAGWTYHDHGGEESYRWSE